MAFFEVRAEVEFDYGHRIASHKSKCRNVHGHRAKVQVTVQGSLRDSEHLSENGMVMDFGDVKNQLRVHVHNMFDHAMILDKRDDLFIAGLCKWANDTLPPTAEVNLYGDRWNLEDFGAIQFINGPPTAENMAFLIFECLSNAINTDMGDQWVTSVRFFETPTSMAEYKKPEMLASHMRYLGEQLVKEKVNTDKVENPKKAKPKPPPGSMPLSYEGCAFTFCDHMHICQMQGCIHPRND